jgi:hypothetical protein
MPSSRSSGRWPGAGRPSSPAASRRSWPWPALTCGGRLPLLDEPLEGVAPALAERIAEGRLFDQVYVIERGGIVPA